jgi:hypothetical protein
VTFRNPPPLAIVRLPGRLVVRECLCENRRLSAFEVVAMLSDTHPDAERVQIEQIRKTTPREKMATFLRFNRWITRLSREGIARAHPDWDERQVRLMWMELAYGAELAAEFAEHLERREPCKSS